MARRQRDSIESMVARMFVAGFSGLDPDPELKDLLKLGLGGVILFARNLPDLETTQDLNRRLTGMAHHSLVLGVDQEGGRVQRLQEPVLQLPPMRTLGSSGDAALCRACASQLGRELAALGFHLDFAPVLDVDSNPDNPIIGNRSFGREPAVVAELGIAFAQGLQAGGVGACAKHFPGHGDTSTDSHKTLPVLACDRERLERLEFVPFRAAARSGVATVMLAHLLLPVLGPEVTSLSAPTYRLLREEMGFDGLILTDDLEMKAVADNPGVLEAARAAVSAGADGVLVCHDSALARQAVEVVAREVVDGRIDRGRIEASVKRWEKFARTYEVGSRLPDAALFRELQHSPERREIESRLGGVG